MRGSILRPYPPFERFGEAFDGEPLAPAKTVDLGYKGDKPNPKREASNDVRNYLGATFLLETPRCVKERSKSPGSSL